MEPIIPQAFTQCTFDFEAQAHPQKIKSPYVWWTPEEVEILKNQFPITLTKDLQVLLPRHPLRGIISKAADLELRKTHEYRKECNAVNRENAIRVLRGGTPWNKQPLAEKTCPTCNTNFIVTGREKNRICCSLECANIYKGRITGTEHPLYKEPAQRTCQWCGKAFTCKPSIAAMGEGLYCSRHCLGSATTQAQGGRRSSLEFAIEQVLVDINEPFEAQKQVGPWLVDFYLPARNLVIECDGKYWHSRPEVVRRDAQKNGWLSKHGYALLRLGEDAIRADAKQALLNGVQEG